MSPSSSSIPEPELPEGCGFRVLVDGCAVALFRTACGWVALDDRCPHAGASLSEGRVADGQVTCPWHGLRFDAATGACASAGVAGVRAWRVEEVQGGLRIER